MSGADEIVVNYAVYLKRAGYSPAVLLVHSPAADDALATRLREAGVPLSCLASPRLSSSLATGRKVAIGAMRALSPVRELIRNNSRKIVFELIQRYHDDCCEYLTQWKPDIVHVLTPDPGAVMLIRAAHSVGIPVVYQEVGMPFHPPGFEDVYQRFVSVLPLCSEVAILSPSLAREMLRVVPEIRRPQVVPLISIGARNNGQQNGGANGSVCFGFASRLEHLKGPLRLIEAFEVAHRSYPSVSLKIAGEGSQRKEITRELRRLRLERRCELVGTYSTVEERSRFMHDIDVFVLPSLTEGTPNAIIEAMAHSKPVIATDVGGIPDFVSQDVGMVVPSGDQAALAAAMTRLAGSVKLRIQMGQAARLKYQQMFSPEVVLPLLSDFYQSVLNRSAAEGNGRRHNVVRPLHPWFQDTSGNGASNAS